MFFNEKSHKEHDVQLHVLGLSVYFSKMAYISFVCVDFLRSSRCTTQKTIQSVAIAQRNEKFFHSAEFAT